MKRRWSQPPVTAAGSPKRDRGLDGAPDQWLPPRACARIQHWVHGRTPARIEGRSRLNRLDPNRKPPATYSKTRTASKETPIEKD
jgi:hypothetical protein